MAKWERSAPARPELSRFDSDPVLSQQGEMAEWLIALVLKTGERDAPPFRGFESHSLRHQTPVLRAYYTRDNIWRQ